MCRRLISMICLHWNIDPWTYKVIKYCGIAVLLAAVDEEEEVLVEVSTGEVVVVAPTEVVIVELELPAPLVAVVAGITHWSGEKLNGQFKC